MQKEKILDGLAAAVVFAFALTHPTLAQETLGEETTKFTYAMHDIPDPVFIKTNLGIASILIERICEVDASGRIEISLRGGDLDPQKGALLLEAKPIILGRINDSQAVQVELKSPEVIAKLVLRKDQPFMVYLKEKLGISPVKIVKNMDVVHYCRPIRLVDPPFYPRSPNFQEQELDTLPTGQLESQDEY